MSSSHFFQKHDVSSYNFTRVLYDGTYPGCKTLAYFFRFDLGDFITHPYVTFDAETSFLNYILKTVLYAPWNHPGFFADLPHILNGVLLIFLLATLGGTIAWACKHHSIQDIFPYITGVMVSLIALTIFMLAHCDQHSQNLRYAYPLIIPMILLFVRGMETVRTSRIGWPFYWLGMAAALFLPAGGALLYLSEYIKI